MQVPLGRTFLSFLLFLEHHHHHYQQQQPQPPSTEIIAILGRLPSFDSPFYFLLRIFLFLFSLSVSFSAHSHTPTDRTGSPYLITPTSCILFTHTHTLYPILICIISAFYCFIYLFHTSPPPTLPFSCIYMYKLYSFTHCRRNGLHSLRNFDSVKKFAVAAYHC